MIKNQTGVKETLLDVPSSFQKAQRARLIRGSGLSFDEVGGRLQRTAGSIRARLHKFGLVDEDGNALLPRRDMDASNLQWHVDHTGQWQPVDRDSLVAA